MRGSPLIRALLAFIIIGLLGWPLARLTHRSEAKAIGDLPVPISEEKPVFVAMSFTQLPRRVAISHLGQEKWATADIKDSKVEAKLNLAWPVEGVDLRVAIDWPEGTSLMGAQVRVTDPEGTEHVASIFAKGPADEILTFH